MPRGGRVKRYPEDFKESAVQMVLSRDESILSIARELGISHKTLYGWVQRYKRDNGLEKQPVTDDSVEAELKRLRKENATLKMERDILKKATAYFAKETM